MSLLPPRYVADLLGDLEHYNHADDDLAPLLRFALMQVECETIRPYFNGNGRLGRLVAVLSGWRGRDRRRCHAHRARPLRASE